MTVTTSRRALLAGAAAIPLAVAAQSAADAATAQDPIFAAIDRHRRALAQSAMTSSRDLGEIEAARIYDLETDALLALLQTTPTTVAGCAAVLRHIGQHSREDDCGPYANWLGGTRHEVGEAGGEILEALAAVIDGRATA